MGILFATVVPLLYMIVGMIGVMLFGISFFMIGDQTLIEAIMRLAGWYAIVLAYADAAVFVFIAAVTIVQIAMIEFHDNDLIRDVSERRLWIRFILAGFALVLPPAAFEGIHLRLAAQQTLGLGFLNEGSLVYMVGVMFLIVVPVIWSEASELGRRR